MHQSLHTGAHIDSPLHVFKDGITTAEISLDQVMGEALVVDLSFAGANHAITIDDLKRGGADDVRQGDIVLLRTDWTDKMYGRWPDYFTQSPYFPPETAEWLVAKGPKNIGFDFFEEYCARLPDFSSEDFPMHRVILGAGVVIMEGLTSLGALPAGAWTSRRRSTRSPAPRGSRSLLRYRLASSFVSARGRRGRVAAGVREGRRTTRRACAAPRRLGSIWARASRFPVTGTGPVDPLAPPPPPGRVHRARAVKCPIWTARRSGRSSGLRRGGFWRRSRCSASRRRRPPRALYEGR